MNGANYDSGRIVALKMANHCKPDDYAHSPGSCPVNQKKVKNKTSFHMKQMIPRPTISSKKRLELSTAIMMKRKQDEDTSLKMFNQINNRAAKLNESLPCSMGPLNDLRHQQETCHPALTSENAVKNTREMLSSRQAVGKSKNKAEEDSRADTRRDSLDDTLHQGSRECATSNVLSPTISDLDITSISEQVTIPVQCYRTYTNLHQMSGETTADGSMCSKEVASTLQAGLDRKEQGDGGSMNAVDVKKELDEQGLVAIVELLASNKEKQEALMLQEKEMDLMKVESKSSLEQLENQKNREIEELKEKLQCLSNSNENREQLASESHKSKLMKYKRVIYMLRKQVNQEHSGSVTQLHELREEHASQLKASETKMAKVTEDIRELMNRVEAGQEQVKALNMELLDDGKEIEHLKQQLQQQAEKELSDSRTLDTVRKHVYMYLTSPATESSVHFRDVITSLSYNREHLACILLAIKQKQMMGFSQ